MVRARRGSGRPPTRCSGRQLEAWGRAKDAAERADLVRAAIHCLAATVNETTEEALAEV